MIEFFNTFFYLPLYNALVWLYTICASDLGLAVIALTVIIKLILLPLSKKQISSQKDLQRIQPEIKEIQKKYKDDRQKAAQETMRLYKENNISLGAGCLPLIFQVVIFFTMYRVVINMTENEAFVIAQEKLYSFVPAVETLNQLSVFGLKLGEPSIFLAVVTAFVQWYQIYMMQKKSRAEKKDTTEEPKENGDAPDFATIMQKQMLFIIPGMTLFIGVTFPSALTLYWLASTIFTVVQQWSVMRGDNTKTA